MRIALATCRRLPEPDPDQRPLLDALRSLGADAKMLAWDDPASDCAGFDLCVIRSTWNYHKHLREFLAWARKASRQTKLMNPWKIVRWNSDKIYLKELESSGIRTIPTVFYPRGGKRSLQSILVERGWTDVVIKPRISASSFMTRRFGCDDLRSAADFLAETTAQRHMMIQPYVRSVETRGERSLIYIAGELTHAVRKSPRLAKGLERVSSNIKIDADERRFALRAIGPFKKDILYARIDVARGDDGGLMLMELELIEPSLFLWHAPRALGLFAHACAAAAL